mmetsp:Transcript_8361/g.30915  ORF Transcript_8361/g.30915 Transcript_8361/m.30915 type:complete len:677 (-) Transcript_8361:24-2054(-)
MNTTQEQLKSSSMSNQRSNEHAQQQQNEINMMPVVQETRCISSHQSLVNEPNSNITSEHQQQQQHPTAKISSSSYQHKKPLKSTLSMHEIKQEKLSSMRMRTKSRRNRILWAKRLKVDGNEAAASTTQEHQDAPLSTNNARTHTSQNPLPELNWEQEIKRLDSSKANERKAALKMIRKVLSRNVSLTLLREVILQHTDLPKLLLKHLLNQTDSENQLEAAWCITNLCCVSDEDACDSPRAMDRGDGEPQQESLRHHQSALAKLFVTVPHLVEYVQYANRSSHMILLGKQCLWALGNIAAESLHARQLLLNHRLLPILLDHMYGNSQLMKIACWCLGNLVRRMPNQDAFVRGGCLERVIALLKVQLRKYFGVSVESQGGGNPMSVMMEDFSSGTTPTPSSSPTKFGNALSISPAEPGVQSSTPQPLHPLANLELYQNSSTIDLLWIMAYNTSVDSFDLLNDHIRDIYACVSVILYHCPHWEIHVPCLRTIGNLFRGPNSVNSYILQHDHQLVPFLCTKLSGGVFANDLKDCLYVLSNIAGGPEEDVQLLVNAKISELLVKILMQDHVSLEAKREAIFTMTNICSDGRHLHEVMFDLRGFEACIHMLGEVASNTELSLLLLNFIRFVFEYCASESSMLKRRFVDCNGPNYLQHLYEGSSTEGQVSVLSVNLYNAIANI